MGRLSTRILCACFLMLSCAISASAATWLGVLHTQEEVWCWRQRAQIDAQGANGITCPVKYKSIGDVSTNSPGDWDSIVANANALTTGSGGNDYFSGCTQSGYSCPMSNGQPDTPRTQFNATRDAAFSWLVSGNTNHRDKAKTQILSLRNEPGWDWTSTSRWPQYPLNDGDPVFGMQQMLMRLFYAYTYVRDQFTAGEQSSIDTWFLQMGDYWERTQQTRWDSTGWFANDRSTLTDFSLTGSGQSAAAGIGTGFRCDTGTTGDLQLYCGGITESGMSGIFNNRTAEFPTLFGLIGIYYGHIAPSVDTARYIQKAKRWVIEWLLYSTWPTGEITEWGRSIQQCNGGIGWRYSQQNLAYMLMIAEALARDGDTELYDMVSTSSGLSTRAITAYTGSRTWGAGKSLQFLMRTQMGYTVDEVRRAGYNCGSPTYPDDYQRDEVTGVRDTYAVPSNLYWQDNCTAPTRCIQTMYQRTSTGAIAYPSGPTSGGTNPWGGVGGALPGVLFMYGQLEGVVNPYSVGPPAPSFTFTASTPVPSGQQSTLTWSPVSNATSCTASVLSGQADTAWSTAGAGPTSDQLRAGGSKLSTPRTSATTYRMSCTDGTNTVNRDAPVTINALPNPVAHWTLSNTSSPSVDTIASFSCTWVNSPTSITGQFGNGLSINGTADQSLDCGDILDFNGPFSFSFWIKDTSTPASFQGILGRAVGTSFGSGYGFYWNAATQLGFYVGTDVDAFITVNTPSQWNHIVGTYDGSQIRLYVNAVAGTPVTISTTPSSPGGTFHLGKIDSSGSYDTPGLQLDEVWGFNYALSQTEITNLMNLNTASPACTTPTAGAPYPRSSVITCLDWDFAGNIRLASDGTTPEGSDLWPITWASDGNLYTAWGDGTGFSAGANINEGVAKITSGTPTSGQPSSVTGCNVNGSGNSGGTCAATAALSFTGSTVCPDPGGGTNCKASSILAVPNASTGHSRLYIWHIPNGAGAPLSELAWSDDFGVTWAFSSSSATACTVSAGNGVCFQGLANDTSPASFLQWGQDAAGHDGFIYTYFTAIGYSATVYLQRVAIGSILTQSAWQWFAGFDGSGNPAWSSTFANRVAVFTDANSTDWNPGPSVTYLPAIQKYVMTISHYGPGGLGVFEASHPWGESGVGWHTVAYYPKAVGSSWGPGGGYNEDPGLINDEGLIWSIVPKWSSLSGTTLTAWVVYSGFDSVSRVTDSFNAIKATMTVTSGAPPPTVPSAPKNLRVVTP